MKRCVSMLAFLVLASAAAAQVDIPDWESSVSFEVVASQSAVRPGDQFEVALVATIEEGYHLYGPEEMEPSRTELRFEAAGLSFGEADYPPVIRRDLSGLGTYDLYEGRIVIRVPATAGESAGAIEAKATVNYQVCTDFACSAPATDELTMTLPVAKSGASVESKHEELFKPKH